MEKKTNYVGNLKPIGEDGLRMRIKKMKLDPFWKTSDNGEQYIDVIINRKQTVDEYGQTHYMKINDWVPTKQTNEDLF